MMNATFTAHEITVNGKTFPAEYSITPANTVFAFVTVQEENREPVNLRIKIDSADPNHAAALEAAQAAREQAGQVKEQEKRLAETSDGLTARIHSLGVKADKHLKAGKKYFAQNDFEAAERELNKCAQALAQWDKLKDKAERAIDDEHDDALTFENLTAAAEPAPKAEIIPVRNQFVLVEPLAVESIPQTPAEPSSAAQAGETPADSKQARGPVPEKLFVGLEIKGKGWEIFFDGGHERTRVIFKRKPVQAALDAVKAAGFFWSPTMKSWNKKLTHKAFRSAQALAVELRAICG